MTAFFQYTRNITYYLLFAALVGMAVPSDKYKNYIKLFMGLILVSVTLSPIQLLLASDGIPITQLFAQIIPVPAENEDEESWSASYEQWRYESVKAAFDGQINAQLLQLLTRHGYTLLSAQIDSAGDFSELTRITVLVSPTSTEPTPRPFIRIEPIRVTDGSEAVDDEQAAKAAYVMEIKKLIADFYQMTEDNIHVEIHLKGEP